MFESAENGFYWAIFYGSGDPEPVWINNGEVHVIGREYTYDLTEVQHLEPLAGPGLEE